MNHIQNSQTSLAIGLTYNLKRTQADLNGDNDSESEFESETTLQAISSALESLGHRVQRIENTPDLPRTILNSHLDLIFNLAEGFRGRAREAQVPAFLDLIGIEYTGSDAATLVVCLDKFLAKQVVQQAGVHTPASFILSKETDLIPNPLKYPVIIKPLLEGSSKGIHPHSVVLNSEDLKRVALNSMKKYQQAVLVEEYISGRELTVGVLQDQTTTLLPPLEIIFRNKKINHPIYTFEHKQNFHPDIEIEVPAKLTETELKYVQETTLKCFTALGCRDIARMDFRLSEEGFLYFIECNPIPGIAPDWSDLCQITRAAGISYVELIQRILAPAIKRRHLALKANQTSSSGIDQLSLLPLLD